MRQQLSESWLSHYYWHMDGQKTPWIPASPERVDSVYDGKITVQASSGDFDADNRTNALFEELTSTKKVIILFPPGIVSVEFRFRADGTAGDQHILQKFIAAGEDHYDLVDVLTIEQGAQVYEDPIYFIDTVGSGGEKWLTVTTQLSDTSNHIGRDTQNMHGYDRVLFVASTLDTTGASPNMSNLYIDWKQL